MLDDLNIHDDFLDEDAFWAVKSYAQTSTYYTPEELNKMLGINEGWTGLRTINVKTIFSGLTEKIEKTTGKVVDRLHFYKCEGNNIPNFEEPLGEISRRTHRDDYPWAGVIYIWGEAGTYYNGEKIDFKENRFIWYNGQEPHAPMASIEDRCVMVVFMLDKSSEV